MSVLAKKKKSEPSTAPILNEKVVVIRRYASKDIGENEDDDDDDSQEYEHRGDTYTVFKNHNEELVAKIKELAKTPFDGTVDGGWEEKGKIDSELGEQYLCKTNAGRYFLIDKSELEEQKKRFILNLINKTYPVGKYFNENFGYIFGTSHIVVNSPESNEESDNDESDYDSLGEVNFSETELDIYDLDGNITLQSAGKWGSFMFMHFDEEGNYVNRDYNLNLVVMSQEKPKTLDQAIRAFTKVIPAGNCMRKDNIWYMETCALEVSVFTNDDEQFTISLRNHPIKANGTYASRGTKPFKIPKDAVESKGRPEIMEIITPALQKFGFTN